MGNLSNRESFLWDTRYNKVANFSGKPIPLSPLLIPPFSSSLLIYEMLNTRNLFCIKKWVETHMVPQNQPPPISGVP